MSRPVSIKTRLRYEHRLVCELRAELQEIQATLNTYRIRLPAAEKELAEWKQRFDLLLARTPESLR